MNEEIINTVRLKDLASKEGADLFGTADIRSLKKDFLFSSEEIESLDYAVSIGVRLSPSVLRGIKDKPTLLYKWHYQQANQLLDKIAFLLAQRIVGEGHDALPVPASQMVDWINHKGHVSHRAVGEAAGLGWRGRNNLLVTPDFGAQFRLATVLTDLPLETRPIQRNGCGSCHRCVEACPAGALGSGPQSYDLHKCHALLTGFSKERGIGVHICGICVKACRGGIALSADA